MRPSQVALILSFFVCCGTAFSQSRQVETDERDNPKARAEFEWLRLRDPATGNIPRGMRTRELSFAATLPTKEFLLSKSDKQARRDVVETLNWAPRGPVNVGGRTRALAVDITNVNMLLAGGVSGGMWRTVNGGTSWLKVTNVSDIQSVTCLAQDKRSGKTSTWYYGTGEIVGNSAAESGAPFRGDGIFKSTDNGISWTLLSSTSTGVPQTFDHMFDYVWNVATDASNGTDDVVYAATYGGINLTTDGGNSWTPVLGSLSNNSYYTDVAVTTTGVAYATLSSDGTTTRGIFRSTNGTTWTNITPGGWPSTYYRIVIGIAPSNENEVYFLGETSGGTLGHSIWKYAYVSGDGSGSGGAWVNRSANIPAFGGSVGDFDSQGSYDLVIKVKPDEDSVVYIGGTNLYRSTDGFKTSATTAWIGGYSTLNDVSLYPYQHPDQHALVFSPVDPSVLYAGDDGGVQRSADDLAGTVSWISLNNGYLTSQFYTVAIDHGTAGNNIVVGGMQDNGTWFTNTASSATPWVDVFGGDGTYSAIADGRTSYYVSAQNADIYRFVLDNNGNYSQWARVDPTGGSGYLFVNPFALDPNNTKMMYLAGGLYVWRNTDLTAITLYSKNTTTKNWTKLTNSSIGSGTITALGVSKSSANRLYYGTSDGRVMRLDGANSGNPSPTNVTGSNFPSGGYVSCIAVDPTDWGQAIVVFSNYNVVSLYSTTNAGATWTAIAGNLEQNPDGSGNGPSCRWAAIVPGSGYLVSTSTGLYSTATLNGSSTVWAQEGSGMIGNVVVDMIDVRQSDKYVVVGTHGNGVYAASFPPLIPLAPSLVSPADGAGNQPISLVLSWSSSAGATSYHLQVSTDSLFGSTVVDDSTIVPTSRSIGGLANSTTYYWRVGAKNSSGLSPYSSRQSFTTIIAAPMSPLLFSPADGFASQPTTMLLSWHPAALASTYRLQVALDSFFTTLVVNDSTLSDTSRSVGSLANGSAYFWRVSAANVGGTSAFSSRRWFSTIVATPLLVSPTNGATSQEISLKLQWNQATGAHSYRLQLAGDSSFGTFALSDSSIADTSRLVGSLSGGTTYYWRVNGRSSRDTSAWSAVRSFSTISSPPMMPALMLPGNYAVGLQMAVLLQWNTSLTTARYDVQVSTDSNFASTILDDSTTTDTSSQLISLLPLTTYFWRVKAQNGLGWGSWSMAWRFTTVNQVTASYQVSRRWNVVSLPLRVPDSRKGTLFPTSLSHAFAYQGGYAVKETLQNGAGYWLRFDTAQAVNVVGSPYSSDSIAVEQGWNLVGSISVPVPLNSITSVPSGIIGSGFFGYENGYVIADTVRPAKGYWVNARQRGKLFLDGFHTTASSASFVLQNFSQLIIEDPAGNRQTLYFGVRNPGIVAKRFELPPASPAGYFDARFASGRILETFDNGSIQEFPVQISSKEYPVTVRWDVLVSLPPVALRIDNKEMSLRGEGSVEVAKSSSQVSLKTGSEMPKEFSLEQNFPNPFNPTTNLRFSIPEARFVTLKIFDVLGRVIATLVNEEKQQGTYSLAWDAAAVPSGMYVARLSAGSFSESIRMVVAK